jgi:hypothetical protein
MVLEVTVMKNINSGAPSLKQLCMAGSIAALTCFLSHASELIANDMCFSDGTFGSLDVTQVMQEEGPWCWVASTKVFVDRFEMRSPRLGSTYRQCELYNIGQPERTRAHDCCSSPAPRGEAECLETGWPDYIMAPLGIMAAGQWDHLSWQAIKEQICPSDGKKGQPFIYVTQGTSWPPIAHTNVIKGFIEDSETDTKKVSVDDHEITGFQDLDYDCWYVEVCAGHAKRLGDQIITRTGH